MTMSAADLQRLIDSLDDMIKRNRRYLEGALNAHQINNVALVRARIIELTDQKKYFESRLKELINEKHH